MQSVLCPRCFGASTLRTAHGRRKNCPRCGGRGRVLDPAEAMQLAERMVMNASASDRAEEPS